LFYQSLLIYDAMTIDEELSWFVVVRWSSLLLLLLLRAKA
jgi:hypothetical protein